MENYISSFGTPGRIKAGLVSVTFRDLLPGKILELAHDGGLECIEWGGDIHVRPGRINNARDVCYLTKAARLEVAAYGSYYVVGGKHNQYDFEQVLQTALALNAKRVRVWAGDRNSEQADISYWRSVIEDSKRIADLSAKHDIEIVYEYHYGTLANTAVSCRDLLEKVARENVFAYWQPMRGLNLDENCAEIDILSSWIVGVHVFHWDLWHDKRFFLENGQECWWRYIEKLRSAPKLSYLMLEFVKGDDVESFRKDCKVLHALLSENNSQNSASGLG